MTVISPEDPKHSRNRRIPRINTFRARRGSLPGAAIVLLLWLLPAFAAAGNTLVVFGDSLSAAYGIAEDRGWVQLLADRLEDNHPEWTVRNASISGETTDGGLRRIEKVLDNHEPAIIIIELGGNDGLRGKSPETMRRNLAAMIEHSREAGARVLLIGIELPPNYGDRYTSAFRNQYRALVDNHDPVFLPFLLAGIHDREGMMQNDGIHPTARAQPLILDSVWEKLEPML